MRCWSPNAVRSFEHGMKSGVLEPQNWVSWCPNGTRFLMNTCSTVVNLRYHFYVMIWTSKLQARIWDGTSGTPVPPYKKVPAKKVRIFSKSPVFLGDSRVSVRFLRFGVTSKWTVNHEYGHIKHKSGRFSVCLLKFGLFYVWF